MQGKLVSKPRKSVCLISAICFCLPIYIFGGGSTSSSSPKHGQSLRRLHFAHADRRSNIQYRLCGLLFLVGAFACPRIESNKSSGRFIPMVGACDCQTLRVDLVVDDNAG